MTTWSNSTSLKSKLDKRYSVGSINEQIKSIYKEGELTERSTIRKFLIVQKEGIRQTIMTAFRNYDEIVIIPKYQIYIIKKSLLPPLFLREGVRTILEWGEFALFSAIIIKISWNDKEAKARIIINKVLRIA